MPNSLNRPEKAICPAVCSLLITIHSKAVLNRNYFHSLTCGSHNSLNSALYKEAMELSRQE
jgi:hypothetical protein